MGKLDGRVAIVTGATRGLGREIAKAFMAEGAKVATWTRTEQPEGMPETTVRLNGIPVTDPESADEFVNIVSRSFQGRIDILINCAGVYGPIGPTETVDWDEYVETIHTNLLLPVMMCRAVVPYMRKRGYGKIVQVSGGGATRPAPNASAYAASKAGVVRFSETLAEELCGSGIDVNSMAPGAMPTRIQQQIIEAGPVKAGEGAYAKAQEVTGGNADAIFRRATDLAVFLASAESDGITGKLISVWDLKDRRFPQDVRRPNSDMYTLRRVDTHLMDEVDS